MFSSLFLKSNTLLTSVIYQQITNYSTFLHFRSYFGDCDYNFICPKVASGQFSWLQCAKLVAEEQEKNVHLSFYIHHTLNADYHQALKAREIKFKSDDTYVFYQVEKPLKFQKNCQIIAVNRNNFKKYQKITQMCFPDWENNQEYATYFYQKSQLKNANFHKQFINLILYKDKKAIAIASLVIDPKTNLAYLHNTATLATYRRQGYFTILVKHCLNLAYSQGVKAIYSLVEKDGQSFLGLEKIGFKVAYQFFIYPINKKFIC